MKYLLTLSIGPVQDFIAAARKMGDLWCGSELLSDIACAAARKAQESGATLIFPAPTLIARGSNVANILLMETAEGADPKKLADDIKTTARAAWKAHAGKAFAAAGNQIRTSTWDAQVDDVLELFAAWVPCTEKNYTNDRRAVMQLLAARKMTRNFNPAKGEAKVLKSSLDGLRETVLQEPGATRTVQQLRLSTGEQLDCVGVVKRLRSKENRFPSIPTIAAGQWLRDLKLKEAKDAKTCDQLKELFKTLHEMQVITSVPKEHQAILADWAYDAEPLYVSRHDAIRKENPEVDAERLDTTLKQIAKLVGEASRKHGIHLDTYYCIIKADGDRMGEALDKMKNYQEHQNFSKKLATFADSVPTTLRNHNGVCIYSGGDDILAFVPVQDAIQCCAALADTFKTEIGNTLSVGMAIVHIHEPLSIVREYAMDAEHNAKGSGTDTPRNGFAIHLHARGTDSASVRGQWSTNLHERMQYWQQLFAKEVLPSNLPYACRRDLADLKGWQDATELSQAIPQRLSRVLFHKDIKWDRAAGLEERVNNIVRETTTREKLDGLIEEWIISRFLAAGGDR